MGDSPMTNKKDNKQRIANSVSEFLEFAIEFTNLWFQKEKNWGPWFRGHNDASWELMPKLYRDRPPAREDGLSRTDFGRNSLCALEFERRTPPKFLGLVFSNATFWRAHQVVGLDGSCTCLALYFAVRDKKDKTDAAVWSSPNLGC